MLWERVEHRWWTNIPTNEDVNQVKDAESVVRILVAGSPASAGGLEKLDKLYLYLYVFVVKSGSERDALAQGTAVGHRRPSAGQLVRSPQPRTQQRRTFRSVAYEFVQQSADTTHELHCCF